MRSSTVPALALAVVLALVAGCVQNGVQPASVALPPVLAKPFATLNTVIDATGGEGEPSMGIAPDGSIYANGVSAPGSQTRSGSVYKSTDNGTTFKRIADPTAPMPNDDPDLAVSQDGVVWFSALGASCNSAAASKDGGKTWTSSPLACAPPAADRQYVIPEGGCNAIIYSHDGTFRQTVATTSDCAATWVPAPQTSGDGLPLLNGNSGWGGGGFYDYAKKTAFMTFSYFDGGLLDVTGSGAWHPSAAISHDGGQSWTLAKLPNAGGQGVGLSLVVGAADRAGNVYLAWAEAADGGKHMIVYLARSVDDGKTWTKPIVVDDDAGSKVFPAITAGDAGRVAVAYYHTDEKEYPATVSKDAKWNVTLAWTKDALADTVSWERANLSAQSARTGPICPDGSSCTANRQLLDYFALHVAPDGRVASVWTSTDAVKGKVVNVFGMTSEPLLAAIG